MADRSLNYRITVDQTAGTAGIRDFSRTVTSELRKAEKSLDDTESASKRAARALSALADEAETELRGAARAADALAAAMGPEMAASLGRNGIAQAVGDLNRMGVSFDAIEADAVDLAAALKRIDDVQVSAVDQGLGNLGGKLREVGEHADQSRSVLANMAGNSAQSLGQLGGIVGDLGVGIGQLAEYATEGGIGLRGLASIAGPMAGLAVATQAFTAIMDGIDFSKKFRAEQIESWSDAIADGATSLSHFNDMARTTGLTVDAAGTGFAGLGRHAEDLLPHLQTLGLSIEDFNRLVSNPAALRKLQSEYNRLVVNAMDGVEANDALASAMGYVIAGAQDQASAMAAANDEIARVAEVTKPTQQAAEDAFAAWSKLKDPIAQYPEQFDRIAAAMRDGATPAAADLDAVTDGLGITMGEAFDMAEQLNGSLETQRDRFDTAARDADRLAASTGRVNRAWDELSGDLNRDRSLLDLADQMDDIMTKGEEAFKATKSGAADAEQKQRDYEQSIIDTKLQVIELGEQYGVSIPDIKETLLLIDQGHLDEALAKMKELTKPKSVDVDVVFRTRMQAGTQTPARSGIPFPTLAPPPPAGPAARGAGLDGAVAPAAAVSTLPPIVVDVPAAAVAPYLTVDMRGAILGSRYDVVRAVRAAARDGIRLAGTRGQAP